MKKNKINARNLQITSTEPAREYNRRAFVKRVLAAGAAAHLPFVSFGASGPKSCSAGNGGGGLCPPDTIGNPWVRRQQAYDLRVQTAQAEFDRPLPPHPNNGDEEKYPNKIGNYSKGLAHNRYGEVDLNAYQIYLRALAGGSPSDFARIPLGCPDPASGYKLVNPQAGLAFDLEGVDSHATFIPPAPGFGSDVENAEMVELYWMALTRDIPFMDFECNPLIREAADDLTRLGPAFRGPKENGRVTPQTLFRDDFPGCLSGPYCSQFRYLAVPFGANYVEQRMQTVVPDQDFMTTYDEWLRIQNGCYPSYQQQFDPIRRYIRDGRDAAQWVHSDTINQAGFMAMLTLVYPLGTDAEGGLIIAPLNPGNPYVETPFHIDSHNQTGFGTFGLPHVATLCPEVTTRALKAVWFQKWFVHRRLRPEAYGGCIQNTLTGVKQFPINAGQLLRSPSLEMIFEKFNSYLLPQVFAEGCPLHPSYGQGHGVAVGACVTILKAFFDENYVIPFPVQPTADGLALEPYTGRDADRLTVGGELNKLASNIAQGRNMAGVHWRSDGVEAIKLGEDVAISILRDQKNTYNEDFHGFRFTRFDGTPVVV